MMIENYLFVSIQFQTEYEVIELLNSIVKLCWIKGFLNKKTGIKVTISMVCFSLTKIMIEVFEK